MKERHRYDPAAASLYYYNFGLRFDKPCVRGVTLTADVKSLVNHLVSTTHSQLTDEELLAQGIKPNNIRLSGGIESVEDLIAALDGAFDTVK